MSLNKFKSKFQEKITLMALSKAKHVFNKLNLVFGQSILKFLL